jgi:hypothetical protein
MRAITPMIARASVLNKQAHRDTGIVEEGFEVGAGVAGVSEEFEHLWFERPAHVSAWFSVSASNCMDAL